MLSPQPAKLKLLTLLFALIGRDLGTTEISA